MFKEVGTPRGEPLGQRRWYQSPTCDLDAWEGAGGRVLALQLCYDRGGAEHCLAWHWQRGLTHHRVEDGEEDPKRNMSPLLVADGMIPVQRLRELLVPQLPSLPPPVAATLLALLEGLAPGE